MLLSHTLMAAISTLFVLQVPVTVSVGSDALLTGVMSLGVLQLVGADQSVIDQSRFLRGNDVAEDDEEERVFGAADAKKLVSKLFRTDSFSDLKKMSELTKLNKVADATDDHMKSVFRFVQQNHIGADDLEKQLKSFPQLDDATRAQAVEMFSNFLRSGKLT
ncbi:RxLR effector protein [Phytophthora megakarya]|uniref:RxLR effector protein n=1 Tax=Phytophthora megakarya TaxID=4795 RepID=A0A225VK83_9STRA|nr:RxLR effector protein [Phytophthora megakarya]